MMRAQELSAASEKDLIEIIGQAEKRLIAQNSFANAGDQRAAMVSGAAIALTAVSVAAAIETGSDRGFGCLVLAAVVASIGFWLSALLTIQSTNSQDFHPPGYRPSDFALDVQTSKAFKQRLLEMAEDYEERLAFNSTQLSWRGVKIDTALHVLLATPVYSVGTALAAWLLELPL